MKLFNKKTITGVAIASVLTIAAVLTPVFSAPLVGAECTDGTATSGGIQGGIDCAKGTGQPTQLTGSGGVFTLIVNILLFIIGAISVIMLIIGGIRYTVSNGDSGNVTAAKNTILYAIIGLIVAFLAFAIVNFVLGSFSTASTT